MTLAWPDTCTALPSESTSVQLGAPMLANDAKGSVSESSAADFQQEQTLCSFSSASSSPSRGVIAQENARNITWHQTSWEPLPLEDKRTGDANSKFWPCPILRSSIHNGFRNFNLPAISTMGREVHQNLVAIFLAIVPGTVARRQLRPLHESREAFHIDGIEAARNTTWLTYVQVTH